MPNIQPGTYKIGAPGTEGRPKYARFYYDFAVDGGLVSSITMRGDAMPASAIVTDSLIHVDTAVTAGASGTIGLTLESAADMQTAVVVTGAPWSTTGAKRGTMTATTAPVKTTAVRSLVAVVGTAAVTAGKFSVVLTYVELA